MFELMEQEGAERPLLIVERVTMARGEQLRRVFAFKAADRQLAGVVLQSLNAGHAAHDIALAV